MPARAYVRVYLRACVCACVIERAPVVVMYLYIVSISEFRHVVCAKNIHDPLNERISTRLEAGKRNLLA